LAEVWNLPRDPNNLERIKKIVDSVKVPPFITKSKRIETDESLKKEEAAAKQETVTNVVDELEGMQKELLQFFSNTPVEKTQRMKALDFEKDDDSNFHIDYIAAVSNLRARMYCIPEVERLKIKAIAGRIMPAIATTTSAVSGLVSIELVKLFKQTPPKLEEFKNLFMNLALPLWTLSEPGLCEKKKVNDKLSFTLWDRWDIKEGDITLAELLTVFEKKYNVVASGVFRGSLMVFVPMFPGHNKRKPNKMSVLLKRKDEKYIDLIITLNVAEQDVSAPPVRFYFEK